MIAGDMFDFSEYGSNAYWLKYGHVHPPPQK
jgi:hypothetical protein